MRFDRLTVTNYRSFEESEIRFEPGVTVVRGVNGAGKSSLLEACFFALYGAAALRTANANLEDVITTDAETCTVELWFTHAGGEFRVRRELKRTAERASQTVAVLETPEGRIDGARAVDDRISSLFRMDAEAFLNCAYVRQGEVNKLIEASAAERQDTIDRLVRLGVLETYRDRASEARLGVKHVRDTVEGALDDVTDQLDAKSEADLQAARERVTEQLEEVDAEIADLRGKRDAAAERKADAEATIDAQEEARAELTAVREEVAELEKAIENTETARAELAADLDGIDEEIEEVERTARAALEGAVKEGVEIDLDAGPDEANRQLDAIDEGIEAVGSEIDTIQLRAEQAREQASELDATADALNEEADEREQRARSLDEEIAEDEAAIEETRAEIAALDDRIETGRERFADAPVEFGAAGEWRREALADREELVEELTGVRSDLKATEKAVERAEELREQGKCPTCGQDVEDSPHVHSLDAERERLEDLEARRDALDENVSEIDDRIERAEELGEIETTVSMLADKREAKRELLDGRRDSIDDKRDQAETYREEATTKREEAAAKREERMEIESQVTDHEERVATLRERRETLRERRETLETAVDAYEKRSELATERTQLKERREHLGELLAERRSGAAEKRSRLDDLEERVDEERVERAKETKREAEERIEALDEEIDAAETRRDGLQNQLGRIGSELDRIEELRERRATLEGRADALDSLYEECEELQRMYADLRRDLRQRNIAALEKLVNEVFDLAYRNDAYDRITLDGEYRATIHEKSGKTLEPGKLSGGERVLFNLALRCAIYQLLVEGAEGTDGVTPMPPLILDEPTAHLDAGHVDRIDSVVSRMREIGVEQTIVVSHTDELIDAADHRLTVEQRPASNRSEAYAEADLLV